MLHHSTVTGIEKPQTSFLPLSLEWGEFQQNSDGEAVDGSGNDDCATALGKFTPVSRLLHNKDRFS